VGLVGAFPELSALLGDPFPSIKSSGAHLSWGSGTGQSAEGRDGQKPLGQEEANGRSLWPATYIHLRSIYPSLGAKGRLDRAAFMRNADTQTTCFQVPDGATLLIVDDDPSLRRSLRRILGSERTSVIEAADGEHAIRVIEWDETQLLDVVLTDLKMPVISGSELIAVLLECRPALAVVAMSAVLDLPPDLLPVPFLRKPFEPEELVRTVAPLVLRSHAMRRMARQARADAAESRSLAERQRSIAKDQRAQSGGLKIALMEVRRRVALQDSSRS
jgi:CheY-like chemotaxis protein